MTPQEAIQKLYEAISDATQEIMESPIGESVLQSLEKSGLRLHGINVVFDVKGENNSAGIAMPIAQPNSAGDDESFLRKLRIDPDIKVQE